MTAEYHTHNYFSNQCHFTIFFNIMIYTTRLSSRHGITTLCIYYNTPRIIKTLFRNEDL